MSISLGSNNITTYFLGTTAIPKVFFGVNQVFQLPAISAIIFGQSELEYLLNTGTAYRAIPQPTPGNGNLVVFTQNGSGVAPTRTVVNSTTVAAGGVNPAMSALSAFLAFVCPGLNFVIGDGAVPGTSRFDLADDTTNATDTRLFTDLTSVVNAIEAETGQPLGNLIECWYNADATSIPNFRNVFWPFYFGTTGAGAPFTLGTVINTRQINNCLWDGLAAPTEKGRGVFTRNGTKWHVLTPMPFLDSPVAPAAPMLNFSELGLRLTEPARQVMHSLASDSLAQSVAIRVGPSAHVCRFGGASTDIHPDTASPDGQILLMWPIAVAMMRAAGLTVNEPTFVGAEGPADGSYADLLVSLPNGGNLTTLRQLRNGPVYAGSTPYQQQVTGIELTKGGSRQPAFRTTETAFPNTHRATVTLQSAFETHVTHGRVGRVRVTPTVPFAFGDGLSYLRGQATASLVEPRDFNLYLDFLIEHVPSLYQAGATYPFEGVAVRPHQSEINVTVPAPAFSVKSAVFNGTNYFNGSGLVVPAGSMGVSSLWFKHTGSTWTAVRQIFDVRVGSTSVISIITSTNGRLTFRLNQDGSGSDTFTTPTNTFLLNTWYHIQWAWNYATSQFQIYINGVALNTSAYLFTGSTKFDLSGANLTQFALGAAANSSSIFVGEMSNFFLDVTTTLDLSVQANREKFAIAGSPVDLGGNGQLPTGSTPEWFYDGEAPLWNNKGAVGNVTQTGIITAGTTPFY